MSGRSILFQSSPARMSGRNCDPSALPVIVVLFQSSPARMSGRNAVADSRRPSLYLFQSSPARMSGRNHIINNLGCTRTVSILARSDERAQPPAGQRSAVHTRVSILARSDERAQQRTRYQQQGSYRFQSSPARMSGRNFAGINRANNNKQFQSSPARMSGRNGRGCIV